MGKGNSFKVPPTLLPVMSKCAIGMALVSLPLAASGLVHPVEATSASVQANRIRHTQLERRVPMAAGSILRMENRAGSIRVQVQPGTEAHLVATRPTTSDPTSWFSISRSDTPPGEATVTISPTGAEVINVEATVPPAVLLHLKTESGSIEVAGAVAGLVAESQSGNILVRLPPDYNADLALHSTSGTVRSELPTTRFDPSDSHSLQARVGRGGPAILLRTSSGNVSLASMGSSTAIAAGSSAEPQTSSPAVSTNSTTRPNVKSDRDLKSDREPSADDGTEPSGAENSSPASERAAVHLEAPLVNLNVSVSDRSGRAMTDLTKGEFTVYENGVRQEITHLAPVTTPFDLVLLLDLSGSTEMKVKVIKQAAGRFVDLIQPEDRLAVYAFRRHVQVISRLTNDRDGLKRRIEDIVGGRGSTGFYDALWYTVNELEQTSNKRKAIVVMTDGVDSSISYPETYPTTHPFGDLIERLEESDVIVYPIYLDTEYETVRKHMETADAYAVARRQMGELAERTAGVLFKAAQVEDLETVYQQVADELRTIYSLAYLPSNSVRDGTWRKISVQVDRPTAIVRTRRGYAAR